MSQYPPPPPPAYDNSPMDYAPQPKTSGMAMTSMILGILSIPLLCAFGIGIIPGIIAIILGIVALSAISRNPQRYGGRGMAIAGIATGAGGTLLLVPLLVAILLPSLGKARELANRSTCAANVRGITQSMCVYAADNADMFPIQSSSYGSTLATSPAGTGGNVCQNMWILVQTGQVAPKQFLCKSDPAGGMPAPMGANFNDDKAYSYSFVFPWANGGKEIGGWYHNDTDASLPLIADMAPANGSGSPAADTLNGMVRNANSFTHQRDGQNIGFGDGHAEFSRVAACGQSSDNMYSANGRDGPSATGTTPSSAADPGINYGPGFGGSRGNWDVCLVPAADGATNTRR